MKRDMDLIRQLLLAIEDADGLFTTKGWRDSEYTREQLREHMALLDDAGLIVNVTHTRGSSMCTRLSWDGHEFLDAARSDTIWQKAKAKLTAATGSLSFELLKGLLIDEAKNIL